MRLATRRRLRLSSLTEGRDLELVLATAALHFPPGRPLTELQANEVLQGFLAGAGCFLDTDCAELRRYLLESGFVARGEDLAGYRRGALPTWLRAGADQLTVDALTEAVRSATRARADEREARRQAWLHSTCSLQSCCLSCLR
jgi:hypothetical protein